MTDDEISELRAAAIRAPGVLASTEHCAGLWSQLVRHQLEIVARFTTTEREYLVLGQQRAGVASLRGRRLHILEHVLCGAGRKVIAYELGISPSTVAQALSGALREMGLECSPARIPPLLVVLAHAARGDRPGAGVTVATVEHGGATLAIVAKDIDSPLFHVLAPAQRAVLRQVIHGESYADIAARRRTSSRTVANQVAAACRRLGVSGRSDLLQFVVSARVPYDGGELLAAP